MKRCNGIYCLAPMAAVVLVVTPVEAQSHFDPLANPWGSFNDRFFERHHRFFPDSRFFRFGYRPGWYPEHYGYSYHGVIPKDDFYRDVEPEYDVDTETNTVVGSPLTVGNQPAGVAGTPDGKYAYVTSNGSNMISIIDTATNTVIGSITLGSQPAGIAVTPDGNYAYVTNTNIQGFAGNTVSAAKLTATRFR